ALPQPCSRLICCLLQNSELLARVKSLESCECRRPVCMWEGTQREDGATWDKDDCTTCICLQGAARCSARQDRPQCRGEVGLGAAVPCAELAPRHLAGTELCPSAAIGPLSRLQLSCLWLSDCHEEGCPCHPTALLCPGCEYDGQRYQDGDAFLATSNPCMNCSCLVRSCAPGRGRGEGCVDGAARREPGEEWTPRADPCQSCRCLDGRALCRKRQCARLCRHPASPRPGTCCPICDGERGEGLAVGGGAGSIGKWVGPTGPLGVPGCARASAPLPALGAPRGLRAPWSLCGDLVGAKRANLLCALAAGPAQCPEEEAPGCPSHPARGGAPPHSLPPPVCVLAGEEFEEGAQWEPDGDPCTTCTCLAGEPVCGALPCPPVTCQHPARLSGDCCPTCAQCSYHQHVYANGQPFVDPHSPCQRCQCTVRGCSARDCPSALCTRPLPGSCCQNNCNGERVLLPDPLPQASPHHTPTPCPRGQQVSPPLQLPSHDCPSALCTRPLPGSCCQNNCNGCSYGGKEYPNGAEFPHPTDRCKQCHCLNGNVQCLSRRCPPLLCTEPILVPNGCCPQCPEPPSGCLYAGVSYQHTQQFYDPSDSCRHCICANGTVTCQRQPCAPVLCTHPLQQDCCRSCDGCHFQGQDLADGETFPAPGGRCEQCRCLRGEVSCGPLPCPGVTCPHPAVGSCDCPVCDGCSFHGRARSNGERFPDPHDACRLCSCLDGSVTCVPVPCSPTPCRNPVTLPGQCCPQCSGACRYQGHLYESGTTFRPPGGDPCSTCTCLVMTCQREPCLQQCTHPMPPAAPSCCPDCDRCLFEGQELASRQAITPPSDPCQRCRCLHGNVLCTPILCPQAACASPIQRPGHCCPECPGCMYNGQEHANGTSWFSSPCVSCLCIHGIATCAQIHCLGSCLRPIEVPGECCPLCAGARAGGRLYSPGESFQPSLDPCEICTSRGPHVRCYRRQCPSLVGCPRSQIQPPGPHHCCPTCAQALSNCTAELAGNELQAADDPCYTCQCKDLTWVCVRQGCPQLSCPLTEQFTPPGACCPICDDSDGSCSYQGQRYQASEHWQVDTCTTCTCVSGEVHCRSQRCPPAACAADETPALTPGMCCPHCLPRPATCLAFGDPHYRTFDGRLLHFQGTCTYVLAQDCQAGDFSIHVTNDDRGRPGVAWTKEVTVQVGDAVVQLLQDWLVKVDGQVVTLPFLKEPHLYVERQTNTVLLNTNIGVKVLWSGHSQLEVSVPGTYKGHMCGLCGDFNGHPQDDARLRSGQLARAEAAFGNSWRVKNGNGAGGPCADGQDVDPCKEAGYRARKEANARCKVLKSGTFEPCHPLVPPEPFFAACVYDLCACGAGADQCLCDVLEAYTALCRRAGLALRWRSPTLCAVGCPQDRGYVFDECGPPCPKTCYNKDAPLGAIESHCFTPCMPGCQCPAGRVEHEAHCILPEACPRVVYGSL
uniref:Kielin cysteine rich BMP regulator n=1 Tax=Gopherus evgoodei TaxID=1825980 RepID=A0A8C4W6S5_9SAUR